MDLSEGWRLHIEEVRPWYWSQTRRPLPSLVFILPILGGYEGGLAWAGAGRVQTGVDVWVAGALGDLGLGGLRVLPLALVAVLVAWLVLSGPRSWWFRPYWLIGMAVESLVLGLALVGLSQLVDQGFTWLETTPTLLEVDASEPDGAAPAIGESLFPLIGYLGAGLYEEALFRLALLPLLYGALRVVQAPETMAGTLAVTGSALAFSLAHHAGVLGEPFSLYAFGFRWLAGVVFAWIFIVRGFGVAVGAHVAYDVLVGYAGWGH